MFNIENDVSGILEMIPEEMDFVRSAVKRLDVEVLQREVTKMTEITVSPSATPNDIDKLWEKRYVVYKALMLVESVKNRVLQKTGN